MNDLVFHFPKLRKMNARHTTEARMGNGSALARANRNGGRDGGPRKPAYRRAQIYTALLVEPATSTELAHKLKLKPANVCNILAKMREAGEVRILNVGQVGEQPPGGWQNGAARYEAVCDRSGQFDALAGHWATR